MSQYKQNKNQGDTILKKSDACSFCGKRGHGKNSPNHLRKQYSQAYNSKCNYCHKLHHHESVCQLRRTKGSNTVYTSDSEMPLFDSLCTTYTPQLSKLQLPLH